MSGACCSTEPFDPKRCPHSGGAGRAVEWSTLAAHSTLALPQRQQVALCLDPDCDVVYFGDRDLELRLDEVHTVPGFKTGQDGLVCYCFLHRDSEIEREVRTTGRSAIAESIRNQIVNKSCACEVRNPSGRCCLGEVEAVIERARKESQR